MSKYWIQTYSTKKYDFVENIVEDVDLLDIANSLAQIPRFGGHLKRPLSVAQHSLTVCAALKKDGEDAYVCLQGLMHDAHEAYGFGDLPFPFKQFLKFEHGVDVDRIERPIKQAISLKFDVDIVNLPDVVHKYDDAVMRTEAQCLFERIRDNWTKNIPYKLEENIKTVLGVKDAKQLFIKTYKDLKDQI